MTPEEAADLRKPFPASAVGKLPKPTQKDARRGNCQECGGYHGLPAVHLDYVGHAATTDRLLQVDPEWTWEPLALDEHGLPALDRAGNMWIRLTVAGVTRIGVGDGKSAKECIGDAIRNAAMRFGVALDLWAKEDLHAMDEARNDEPEQPAKKQPAKKAAAKPRETGEAISDPQLKKIGALMRELTMTDRTAALEFVAGVVGRQVESRNDLSKAEASRCIEALQKMRDAQAAPMGDPPPDDGEEPPGWSNDR